MKLADATLDLLGPDPHARNASKGAADQTADASTPFAGVLSDVDSHAAPGPSAHTAIVNSASISGAGQIGTTNVTASISLASNPQAAMSQASNADSRPASNVTARGNDKTVDDLIGRLFKDVLPETKAAKPAAAADARLPVDDDQTRQTTDQAAPADLMAMLFGSSNLSGSQVAQPSAAPGESANTIAPSDGGVARSLALNETKVTPVATSTPPGDGAGEATVVGVRAGDGVARPLPPDAIRAATVAPTLSDVSVSTHIAPAATPTGTVAEAKPPVRPYEATATEVAQPAVSRAANEAGPETDVRPPAAGLRSPAPRLAAAGSPTNGSDRPAMSGTVQATTSTASNAMDMGSSSPEDDRPRDPTPSTDQLSTIHKAEPHQPDEPGAPAVREPRPTVGTVAAPSPQAPTSALISKITAVVAEAAARSAPPTAATTGSIAPARTLTLSIEQADLGPVSIRMHLSGRSLDLRLTTSDDQTLSLLSRNREALATTLGDRHYQLHSLVIQDGGASATPGGNHVDSGNAGSGARAETQGASGRDTGQDPGGQSGARRNGQQEAGRSRPSDQPIDSRHSTGTARSGSLFV